MRVKYIRGEQEESKRILQRKREDRSEMRIRGNERERVLEERKDERQR